jgi:hypothetical protein
VKITKEKSDNSDLASIAVNDAYGTSIGSFNPSFAADKYAYTVTVGKDVDEIWKNGFWMILSALLLAAAQTVISIIASATASSIATRTRKELYEKINALSLADMAGFSTESLITRTTNDIQNVHLAFLTALRTVFVAPITMVWSIIMLVQTGIAQLTVGTIIWLVLLVVAVIFLILLVIPKYKAVQRLTDALNVASRENLTAEIPIRAKKLKRGRKNLSVFILLTPDGRIAIEKRPDTGLLPGMYQLPNIEGFYTEEELFAILRDRELSPVSLAYTKEAKHVFTHVDWYMQGYTAEVNAPSDRFLWVTQAELNTSYPLPTAFRKITEESLC